MEFDCDTVTLAQRLVGMRGSTSVEITLEKSVDFVRGIRDVETKADVCVNTDLNVHIFNPLITNWGVTTLTLTSHNPNPYPNHKLGRHLGGNKVLRHRVEILEFGSRQLELFHHFHLEHRKEHVRAQTTGNSNVIGFR